MFSTRTEVVTKATGMKYRIFCDGVPLSFAQFLTLLQESQAFREFHTQLLANSPFVAFRWETPAVTQESQDRDYEFVLLNSSGLDRAADQRAFQDQFAQCNSTHNILTFPNHGRDAQLIVPCPTGNDAPYTHLASFLRGAPTEQVDQLWSVVGLEMTKAMQHAPRWLSTAGGGVAWLHVRIDQRPKYYGYVPYRNQ